MPSPNPLNSSDLEALRATMVDVARVAKALLSGNAADVVILDNGVAWRASLSHMAGEQAPLVERVIAKGEVEWIDDMRADLAAMHLDAVLAEPGLRFFAGAPIWIDGVAGENICVGALVVYDYAPHEYDRKLGARLNDLARIVARDFSRIRAVRERAESEDRMARQEERFRIAIENAGLHVYELDFVNRELFKAGAEDTFYAVPKTYKDIYKDPWESLHAPDRDGVVALWDDALAKGLPWRSEHRLERGDGTQVWVFATAKLIADENGKPLRLIGALQNISDRKRAEMQAVAHAAQLRFALESADAAAWSLNEATGEVSGLSELKQLAGFGPDDMSPESTRFSHPEDRPKVDVFFRAVRAGGRHDTEHRFLDPQGNVKWALTSGQAFANSAGGTELIFLTTNITERRKLEQDFADALRQATQSLESKRSLLTSIASELNADGGGVLPAPIVAPPMPLQVADAQDMHARLAALLCEIDLRDRAIADAVEALRASRSAAEQANVAKSQFVANMSHELRTPLNAVIGYAEILEEDLEDAGMTDAAKDAARVRNAARNLLGLINEVLDLAKIEAGKMDTVVSDVDLHELVEDALQTVSGVAAARNNALEVSFERGARAVRTDEVRLRQCLLNLLSNACKFTENGKISINVSRIAGRNGDLIRFIVRDTGIGLTAEQMARLFQAFTQADATTTRKFGGTGLGLSITRKLAQLLGGDVSVASVAGEGSEFTLTVRAELGDPATTEIPDWDNGGPLVLVIEDEADARDLVKRSLSRLSYSARSTPSGAEGLALAGECQPALIVLDIHLSDMSGWDVLARLKADPMTRAIPIIVVSIDDDTLRAEALGADDHFVKPVDRVVLEEAISKATDLGETSQAALA